KSVLNRSVTADIADLVLSQGITDWTKPGRVRLAALGALPRLCVPIRCNNLLLGFLWLIDTETALTRQDIDLAAEVANRAGIALYRRLLLRERSKARHEAILRELVSSDVAVRQQAIEDLRAEELFAEQAMLYQVLAVHCVAAEGPLTAPQEVAL